MEGAMAYETILLDVADGVATLTLNRPERMNTWTAQMGRELSHALRECDDDDAVRAVVLTGSGRAFCAGADLGGAGDTFTGSGGGGEGERPALVVPDIYPFQITKPVIAAINGHAVGVGITYPMTCDIRIAAEDAKIQFAFVRRGILPELGSHAIVARVCGLSNAADLLMSGRMIRGSEAARLGLVSEALPADQVLPAALERAREYKLAAPVSVACCKRLLWEGMGLTAPEMMAREGPFFAWSGKEPDAREGVMSFLERRDPKWTLSAARDLPDAYKS
jgi:enoyl-CoA hydratase/carnithine racemase